MTKNQENFEEKILNKIMQGDAKDKLKELPEKSINMCITSPPYWALRDYGEGTNKIWDEDLNCEHEFQIKERKLHGGSSSKDFKTSPGVNKGEWKTEDGFCKKCGAWKGQLGLEPNFDLYIKHLADIFEEVGRVLRDDGTLWVNLGDTYAGGGGWNGIPNDWESISTKSKQKRFDNPSKKTSIQSKSLVMIPFRFAIEMVNRGWILRNTIIWHKPNCMPSSCKDRFTVDFEYIFFFVKKKKYWFETQYEPLSEESKKDFEARKKRNKLGWGEGQKGSKNLGTGLDADKKGRTRDEFYNEKGKNKRTTWKISPKPFPEAHFAVYPEELIEIPIKSGCPKEVCKKCGKPKKYIIEKEKIENRKNELPDAKVRPDNLERPLKDWKREVLWEGYKPQCNCNAGFNPGIVLDPFFGSGTTGVVALKQGKKFIGIELNQEYIDIAKDRLKPHLEQKKLF